MEKSNIELIKEFAKSTHRTAVAKEIAYPLTGIRTFQKYRRMVYVPNNPLHTSFFVWFSDPYAKIGISTIFCGAFIPLSSRMSSKISIRSKNTLDKLNVFSRANLNKIGNEHFDSKVIISGDLDTSVKRLLSSSKIQDQLLKALEIAPYMNISLNEYDMDFIPEFKGKSYLSIINPQSWTFERDDIEELFRQIEKVRSYIN